MPYKSNSEGGAGVATARGRSCAPSTARLQTPSLPRGRDGSGPRPGKGFRGRFEPVEGVSEAVVEAFLGRQRTKAGVLREGSTMLGGGEAL